MSFYTIIEQWRDFDFAAFFVSVDDHAVNAALARRNMGELDLLALLSDAADARAETMARAARDLTRRNFGNAVTLFTPLYISNYCTNACTYCAFAAHRDIVRRHLSLDEIRREAETIAATGMRHVLLLTGEAPQKATLDYIIGAIRILREYFSSIGIEIYPLDQAGYARCIGEGADSLTIYQEVYDEAAYRRLHPSGPKADYRFRLDAPERACEQAIHAVTVGPLLGLHDARTEAFFALLHARWLQDHFPGTEVSVAFPRLRPFTAEFTDAHPATDRQYVRIQAAARLFLPTAGITVSTRESRAFRDNILPLGVTKMSAGVSTAVGGHALDASTEQFEIADTRSLDEMKQDLLALGFQPVLHDWNGRLLSDIAAPQREVA
jgi:2-iminoacetate synthase